MGKFPRRPNVRQVTLIVPLLSLSVFCLYLALSPTTELWAQVKAPPGRESVAAPLPAVGTFRAEGVAAVRTAGPVPVQNLVTFETAFVQQLNQAIRNPQALTAGKPKVVVLVDTSVWKSIVNTKALVVVEGATTVALNTAQIQDLRDTVLRQVDNAVRLELAGRGGVKQLGAGALQGDVFVANLKPVAAP